MRTVNRNSTMLGIVALLVGLLAAAPAAAADPATQIRELTGAETRIVWLRNKRPSTALGTHLNGTLCCAQHKVPYVASGVMLREAVRAPFYWGYNLKYAT
jgi:hypothetical protein